MHKGLFFRKVAYPSFRQTIAALPYRKVGFKENVELHKTKHFTISVYEINMHPWNDSISGACLSIVL
jgi:hypothetical protein